MKRRVVALVFAMAALAAGVWLFEPDTLASLGTGLPRPAVSAPQLDGPRARRGGMDATFLVTSDTHFGFRNIAVDHDVAIAAMNDIAGMRLPAAVGGTVGKPRGVLISGDLTEDGRPEEWAAFESHYIDQLRYPVYESWGNHDKHYGWFVRERVVERHGHVRYSFDWHDLHVVCLGEAPDHEDIAWLEEDLAGVGRQVGVVLYMHFPLTGPFSTNNWFSKGDYKQSFIASLRGYNVLGIFHGHYHASEMYSYQGLDVYNVGTPKHGFPSFAVVRVTDDRMTVASYNYRQKRWWWWHDKPIHGAAGREQRVDQRRR